MTLESLILIVLEEHRPNDLFAGECGCGFLFDSDHAEHVAEEIARKIGAEIAPSSFATRRTGSERKHPLFFVKWLEESRG